MDNRELALAELSKRELESRYSTQRDSLLEFVKTYRRLERKEELDDNRHIHEICRVLEDVENGRKKRVIINMPPRSLKTELISKSFPVRSLGRVSHKKFMQISYSAELAQKNSGGARSMYTSDTFNMMFPRSPLLKQDQNTKQHRENEDGGQYYAAGSDGTITGVGADVIIIDDPHKPDEVQSDLQRQKVISNYHNTIYSRLNNKTEGAIVIVMQRLHDDDLCGHLLEQQRLGLGDERDVLLIPAIAEADTLQYKKGQSFFPKRFPLEILSIIRSKDPAVFSCQYQQDPINKESQEFHEERFRYHGTAGNETPPGGRIFTTCDPAFKQGQENDNTCIMTAKFIYDKMYILEYTVGKFSADVLIDWLVYHVKKRSPEKVGIEAFQAQSMIITFLKNKLQTLGTYANIEEIKQTGDKQTKIRKLIPLYRDGLIHHKLGMEELEHELTRFPKGRHDDIIDAEQMLYDLYELQPNTINKQNIEIKYDNFGRPVLVGLDNSDWLNG